MPLFRSSPNIAMLLAALCAFLSANGDATANTESISYEGAYSCVTTDSVRITENPDGTYEKTIDDRQGEKVRIIVSEVERNPIRKYFVRITNRSAKEIDQEMAECSMDDLRAIPMTHGSFYCSILDNHAEWRFDLEEMKFEFYSREYWHRYGGSFYEVGDCQRQF